MLHVAEGHGSRSATASRSRASTRRSRRCSGKPLAEQALRRAWPDGRDRVAARLEALWRIALGPGGGADRPAFSAAEAAAMRLVAGWAPEAGLDGGGRPLRQPLGAARGLGRPARHRGLARRHRPRRRPLRRRARDRARARAVRASCARARPAARGPALLVCAAEEAPRFGAGTIGSRLLAGTLRRGRARRARRRGRRQRARRARAATSRRSPICRGSRARRSRGCAPTPRSTSPSGAASTRSASSSASRRRAALAIELRGEAGHAGEVAMDDRRDALAAAAEIVLAIERAARAEPARDGRDRRLARRSRRAPSA